MPTKPARRESGRGQQPSLRQLLGAGYEKRAVPLTSFVEVLRVVRELKRLREAAGLSLPELGKKSGLHPTAISRLENGRLANPTWDTLSRLATALGHRLEGQLVAQE